MIERTAGFEERVQVLGSARAWLADSPKRLFVGGEPRGAASGATLPTINPASGEQLSEVARAASADIDAAVRAARRAYDDSRLWARAVPARRADVLRRLADTVEEHGEELAQLETLDNGKPLWMARIEVGVAVSHIRYYAGFATKIHGRTNPGTEELFSFTDREPVGVCAAIIPWNYPLIMAAQKIAPALCCGNTVVLKPAEQTPLTALRLAELASECGLPEGALSVVTGLGDEAGAPLVAHPDVDLVAFTGSTDVGKAIMRSASDSLKRLLLELGGKSPNIVFADADLEAAAEYALHGAFMNSGQACTAGTRILVEASVHDAFLDRLTARARDLRLGDGLDAATELGPLVSADQLGRVEHYVDLGQSEGATLVAGGARATTGGLDRGFFYEPTIFAGVNSAMTIAREEIFGPVAAVVPFDGEEQAVELANATRYGLAAGVWTNDLRRAHRVARALRAGTVWLNTYGLYDSAVSFGGYKESGIGRELGPESLASYTQTKSIWVNLT